MTPTRHAPIPLPVRLADSGPGLAAMAESLLAKTFFKLILGGSFTEAAMCRRLAAAYARAGIDCIDMAPDPHVLAAVAETWQALPPEGRPVVMVSLPLDPDPHFRKIELDEPACITCGACLPVCPTQALSMPDTLRIDQDLCYGCGRCLPTCPTEALSLLPFQVEAHLEAVLAHPLVQAVEIHTRHADPYMLEALYRRWGSQLAGKLVSLCFRPAEIPPERQRAFVETALALADGRIMMQIDGAPMSGTNHPEASRPAVEAALEFLAWAGPLWPTLPVTISGGINRHTARLLQDSRAQGIAGVGMGTVARQAIWQAVEAEDDPFAIETAASLVRLFKQPRHPL